MPPKFTEIGIDGVVVKEMPVFDGKQTDKYLECSDGQELFYNTTVSKMAEKQFAEKLEHKSLARYKEWRTNFEKNTIKGDEQEIFLMNRYEMMTYLTELEKDTESDPEDRAKRAVAHLRSFKLVAKVVPNKKVYLRSLFWDPHQREKKRMVFQSDVRSVMQHILKQQHFQFCRKSYQKCWGTLFSVHDRDRWISIETLRLVYERIRVNMENITLVPDIEFASGVLSMPLASGCPLIKTIRPNDGEVVTEIHQAMFHVFQKVVCDIDWHDMEKNGKAKEALRRRILELMYSWSTDEFRGRSVNELEVNIGRLLELSSYQHIKKHNVITPLIKLFDGDFMDTVSEDFFYEECKKYGLPYAKDPESDQKPKQMPLWKVRLIFLDAWNDMFFGEGYKWFHEKVKAGIHSRTPINNWKHPMDFAELISGANETNEAVADRMGQQNLLCFEPVQSHPWLNTHWSEHTWINRCPKWAVREELLTVMARPHSEQKALVMAAAGKEVVAQYERQHPEKFPKKVEEPKKAATPPPPRHKPVGCSLQ